MKRAAKHGTCDQSRSEEGIPSLRRGDWDRGELMNARHIGGNRGRGVPRETHGSYSTSIVTKLGRVGVLKQSTGCWDGSEASRVGSHEEACSIDEAFLHGHLHLNPDVSLDPFGFLRPFPLLAVEPSRPQISLLQMRLGMILP